MDLHIYHNRFIFTERPWEIEAYIGGFKLSSLISQHTKSPVYGDDVHIRCDSGGEPVPEITWYKNGRQISNSYKYSLSVSCLEVHALYLCV